MRLDSRDIFNTFQDKKEMNEKKLNEIMCSVCHCDCGCGSDCPCSSCY
ncbi:MAG: hypothetical protein PHR26_01825 [Candidatus ainarchaeum sp.]|nr:hypothetical protein [Candidatus ainarchaeum sp.]MDD3975732.1 hypothetical protein [Candidatus ainarchaeum sp.]